MLTLKFTRNESLRHIFGGVRDWAFAERFGSDLTAKNHNKIYL